MRAQDLVPDRGRADLRGQLVIASRLGAGRRGGRRLDSSRSLIVADGGAAHQRYRAAAKRAVNKRLLLVVGGTQDIVTNKAQRLPQVEAGCREMLHKRRGERAVVLVAVQCRGSRFRRIRTQRIRTGGLQ